MLQPNYLCGDTIKIYLLLITLLITACSITPMPRTHSMHQFHMTVEYNDDIGYNSEGRRILGRATWDILRQTCFIEVPTLIDIEDFDTFIIWGHELLHCVTGHFHKRSKGAYEEYYRIYLN